MKTAVHCNLNSGSSSKISKSSMSSSSSNQASWLACSHLGTQASRYPGIQVSGHPGFRASRLLGSSTNTTKPNQRQQEKAAAAAARPPVPPGSRGQGQRPGSPKPLPGRGGHPWLSHVISPSVAQLSEWSRKSKSQQGQLCNEP